MCLVKYRNIMQWSNHALTMISCVAVSQSDSLRKVYKSQNYYPKSVADLVLGIWRISWQVRLISLKLYGHEVIQDPSRAVYCK